MFRSLCAYARRARNAGRFSAVRAVYVRGCSAIRVYRTNCVSREKVITFNLLPCNSCDLAEKIIGGVYREWSRSISVRRPKRMQRGSWETGISSDSLREAHGLPIRGTTAVKEVGARTERGTLKTRMRLKAPTKAPVRNLDF